MILPRHARNFVGLHASPETRRAYERDLKVFFKFIGDHGLTATLLSVAEVTSFRDYLVETYAPNGAARVWTTVKSFMAYAAYASAPKFALVKAPKRVKDASPRVPSDADVQALIDKASNSPLHSLVIALLLNGLRASEVGQLKRRNVERHEGATMLRVVGKGMKERLIPATLDVQRAIVRYGVRQRHVANASQFLAPGIYGQPLNYRQVEHIVYQYNIPNMHPHALRHHYATRLIRAGVSVLHVQKLLGHSDVSTTQMYVTLDLKDLIGAAKKDPMNNEEARLAVVPEPVIVTDPSDGFHEYVADFSLRTVR